jgi:hypothetical protein
MCTNNSNCNCTDNTCGCKTSTDEVVYQGPPLTCVGINNCDTITEVLQQLNSYICSEELVTVIINNIINNIDLYQQFTTIVNNSVDCETVWACETTTSTTTVTPTTTTTTTSLLPELLRSLTSASDDTSACLLETTIQVYISMTNPPSLEIGDTLYTDNLGISTFDGAFKWWRITQGIDTYSCQISDTGEILTKFACV